MAKCDRALRSANHLFVNIEQLHGFLVVWVLFQRPLEGRQCGHVIRFFIVRNPKLVRGEGRYTDDLNLPNQAYCVMVRSQVANPRATASR